MGPVARRRRRWTGPPPLLIAVTILGLAVAPAVSDEGSPGSGSSSPSSSSSSARLSAGTPAEESAEDSTQDSTAPEPAGPSAPVGPRAPAEPEVVPARIGVASMNVYRDLSTDQLREDARRLTSSRAVDVVGWQEADLSGPVWDDLRRAGWATRTFGGSARELAVSWRRSEFEFVSVAQRRVAQGQGEGDELYRFGDRYVVRVTLLHRASGRLISVVNAHLPQRVENLDDPGQWTPTRNADAARRQLGLMAQMWDRVPGRWAVGTGDYNFDAVADARVRVAGGPFQRFRSTAVSSYVALGPQGIEPTHPTSGRYIDYVVAARKDLRAGRLRFLGHRTIGGFHSDHRALLVRFRLS